MRVVSIPIDWNPSLSIFASENFLQSVGDEYGWLGGIDSTGAVVCFLPYTILYKGPFRLVRFRVETIYTDKMLETEEEKNFLNGVVEYFKSEGMGIIIPATTNSIFKTYPDGAVAVPYGTYIIDLQKSENEIFSNFNSSHRRKVRKAEKSNIQIQSGLEFTEAAYNLIKITFKRSRLRFMDYISFEKMVYSIEENVKIMVAVHEGIIQACVVIPFSQYCAYYVYGGSISQPVTGATNLLHWEAMKKFSERGVSKYDFVGVRIDPKKGSKQEGLANYKERFGGLLVQGYMWKYALKKTSQLSYSMAVRVLRGGDIVDNENKKLK